MKAVVTGGCGFIGSALVDELAHNGCEVLAIDNFLHGNLSTVSTNRNVKTLAIDILHLCPDELAQFQDAYWFHLAALPFIPDSFRDPASIFRTNTAGTLRACRLAKAADALKFVHISTSEVYNADTEAALLTEESSLDPLSPYANSKLAAETIVEYELKGSIDYVVLRLFNSYGPRPTQPYFIPDMIRQCLDGNAIRVGALSTYRDFTFVSDTSRAIHLAATEASANNMIINIGSGVGRSMASVLDTIQRLTNTLEIPVQVEPDRNRPSGRDPKCLVANASKAKDILGWAPEIGFFEGIALTIEYLKRSRDRGDRELSLGLCNYA